MRFISSHSTPVTLKASTVQNKISKNWKSLLIYSCIIQLIIIVCVLIFTPFSLSCLFSSNTSTHKNNFITSENQNENNQYNIPLDAINKLTSEYKNHGSQETIFISLASYRDNECVNTIINAFETALYPSRIYFGVFQQHNTSDGDCSDYDKIITCPYHPLCGRYSQIKIDRIHYKDAKGPMYGRYRSELFYNGQDYLLQVDAHTRFVYYWDNIVIDMFKRINNNYSIITTYPKATNENEQKWKPPIPSRHDPVVGICNTKILSNYMFKHERGLFIPNPGKPVLTPFFAAGFSFSKGHRVLNVPYDPYLPYLFDGEETLMGIRYWTHGYDLYLPDRDIIYHIYEEHRKRPLFWNDDWNVDKRSFEKLAQYRLLYILNLFNKYYNNVDINKVDLRDVNKYNIGNKRFLNDYWNFSRINLDNINVPSPNLCDLLKQNGFKRIEWNSNK